MAEAATLAPHGSSSRATEEVEELQTKAPDPDTLSGYTPKERGARLFHLTVVLLRDGLKHRLAHVGIILGGAGTKAS